MQCSALGEESGPRVASTEKLTVNFAEQIGLTQPPGAAERWRMPESAAVVETDGSQEAS